jgi:hypothetical protein
MLRCEQTSGPHEIGGLVDDFVNRVISQRAAAPALRRVSPRVNGGWVPAIVLPLAVACVALRGFLTHAGFPLQVDATFGPEQGPLSWSFFTPVQLASNVLHAILGGEWGGKMTVLVALFLCGFGPLVLLRDRPLWAQCSAGLFAMLNPWVYDRMAEGQWSVAAAAGSLFLWLAAFEALQHRPRLRRALVLALATVPPIAFSSNFAGILAVLAVVAILGTKPWRDPQRLRWTAAAAALAGIALLYGVIPFFLEHGPGTYTSVQTFSRADWQAFRPTPDGQYSALPTLAGLYGEWAERTGRIPVATSGNPWWIVSALAVTALAVIGAVRSRRRRWLLPAGLLGLALSASTATQWGLDAAVWLSQHFPLLAAYRDTQKWDALWLVALAVLGAEAVASAPQWARKPWATPAAVAVMALATLFPSGINTLRELPRLTEPVTYPQDWYAAAAYLRANVPPASPVAVLPWHLYEPLAFTGRLVANPASVFFPGTLIVPNDPELPGQTAPPPSPGNIGALAQASDPATCALADALRGIGVHWVVLEETVGSEEALRRLRPCGFTVVEGAQGRTSVLRG